MHPLAVEISCSNRGHKLKVKAAEMVPGRSRSCPYCGCVIQSTGDDGRKAQQGLD
jgi:hypothetical protein